jgi:FixJ family two-component response regulator
VSEALIISVVDDDVWAREGIRDLVQSLGYRVSTFSSAEHFLESGQIADTVCVITDLQMPGMNGLELQRRLHAQGHRTPIIFITAYPNDLRRGRAINSGAVGFLSKPFKDEALIHCLNLAIGRSGG